MKGLQTFLAIFIVILSVSIALARYNVQHIQRSRPDSEWFYFSVDRETGNRIKLLERFGTTKEGLPVTKLEEVIPAGCHLAGGYKNYSCGPPLHVHRHQDEYFTVLKGQLGVVIDGKEHTLTPKDKPARIPAGIRHTFWPAQPDKDVHSHVELVQVMESPHPIDFASFIETCYGLGRDYGGPDKINPLQILLSYTELGGMDLPVPAPVMWLIRHVGNPLARLVGYKTHYPEYRSLTA
ncbi:hypothetical protein WJX73_010458 [Symbiochloris irregularis]|uniref:Cupin type-2 domain-containing protein n=1 Tax=Symbiochloris irregularis TaxID=706552 RepID=A0AAW1Q330_9CHLO